MKVNQSILLIIASLMLVCSSVSAQVTAPSLRCISVDGSQIKLDWVISNDPSGEFTKYEVFQSIGMKNFILCKLP